jgi:drug/metabolite transporter (DMT)-like permease
MAKDVTVKAVLLIVVSGSLGVAGQIVLKQALASVGPIPLALAAAPQLVARLATNPLIVAGLAVYLSGTFFWLVALSRVDLSYAYPFASLNYILVLGASWLMLGERVTASRLVGVLAICVGVWFLSRTRATTTGGRRLVQQARPIVGGTRP